MSPAEKNHETGHFRRKSALNPGLQEAVRANRLLARLGVADHDRFLSACEVVELQAGEILQRADSRTLHAYFPLDGVVSLGIAVAGTRRHFEVALVGREGMVGVPLLLGVTASTLRASVVKRGLALRIAAGPLRLQLLASAAFRQRMDQYVLVSFTQMAQAALCTRYHRVDERLARWLLMMQDRDPRISVHATHEFLATTLGVRRAGVSSAAASLQERHLIACHRGVLTLLDREGLGGAACGCYAADCACYANGMGLPAA